MNDRYMYNLVRSLEEESEGPHDGWGAWVLVGDS